MFGITDSFFRAGQKIPCASSIIKISLELIGNLSFCHHGLGVYILFCEP